MAATVLVTGASGAVGRKLVPALRERGWVVRCLVHRRGVESADEVVEGNLADEASLERALVGADAVVHLAAVTHARDPRRYDETNVAGTRNLLAAAARRGVSRFLFVSTRAVSAAGGAYSRSKRDAEELVRRAGLDHTIVRLPELYGGGGREGLDGILARVRRGAPVPIVGDGSDELRPVFVDDAVEALTNALGASAASGKTYTLGGAPVTIREFVDACIRGLESRSRPVAVPVAAVGALGMLGRVLPLPVYPDQLARLRAPKPPVSPDAAVDLGFAARPLEAGLRALGSPGPRRREVPPSEEASFDRYRDDYGDAVQRSIDFLGQDHEFFTEAKARELLRLVQRHAGDPGRLSALDVGCGSGLTDRFLHPSFGSLHGVDVSGAMVEKAAELNPSVDYRRYDGTYLPFRDGTFDVVFAICVLHHVAPTSWEPFVAEMARVARAGGLVTIFEHNPLNPLTRLAVSRCEFDEGANLLGPKDVIRLFARNGLVRVESRYILFFPWRGTRLRSLEERLGSLPLGGQYVVAAARPAS